MDSYAVIGNPIMHSISPQIHNKFATDTKQNISYTKILSPIDSFEKVVTQFFQNKGKGLNITVPFKLEAYQLVDKLTDNAKICKAVNTIKIEDSILYGENTDGLGLVKDIKNNLNITIKDKIILILGAGGSVRGIIYPLLLEEPNNIVVANRTTAKAEELAKEFSQYGNIEGIGLTEAKNIKADIIINATSAFLNKSSLSSDIGGIKISNSTICYDLMYGSDTEFMIWAKNNNAKIISGGLGMLVEQAALSFEFWRGIKPKTKNIIANLQKTLRC